MDIVSFELIPHDPRLYHISLVQPTTILARSVSDVGWLNYDVYRKCEDHCYSGIDLNTTGIFIKNIFIYLKKYLNV